MPPLRVVPVPCLSDNYAYLVQREGSREALVVDPSEAAPVEAALAREGLQLAGILATHHHFDHVGGNEALVASRPGLPVLASTFDQARVPCANRALQGGEALSLAGLELRAIDVPGHTLGALAYVIDDAVFTGDTLFVAGCGRLFEGTPAQMYASLCEKLATLPGETRVFCGHEYTVANARFAASVEPGNAAVAALLASALDRRSRGEPTVPSTIAEERAHNPFLRVDEPALIARYGSVGPVGVLAAVRKDKDAFRA